jgi:outer membrane protein OmpA-like peptidoglycan-associated protein
MSHAAATMPDLLGLVRRAITPDVVRTAASQLGEEKTKTASAVSASVPTVLTALSEVASSDTGAKHLKQVFDQSRRASDVTGGDGAAAIASAMVGSRAAAATDELGPQSTSIAAAVAETTGINGASALKLLGGVASIAFATLGKGLSGMSSSTIGALFREQRGGWVKQLPGSISSLFRGSQAVTEPAYEPERERTIGGPAIREIAHEKRRSWLPLLLLAALALLAIPIIRGLSSRRAAVPEVPPAPVARVETPTVPAPAPEAKTAPPAEAPAAPTAAAEATASAINNLSPLHFAFASTSLTPQSMENLNQVASILQANPEVSVRVVSHTDNIGTLEGNQVLSESRSEAVKTMLVERNIDASRIEAVGAGQGEPIASNDTAAGRAENRRTEIRVTND